MFNDLFTVIDAGDKAGTYSASIARAKEEVQKIGNKIVAIRNDAHDAAQDEIKQAHTTFDESARELIRRFEQVRTSDDAHYREEYEAEHEKLVRAYQSKVETELAKARELVAVKELAAEDPVVEAAVASINPAAYQRGIPSTSQLIDRFRRVAAEVRKASLLPESAGIASHAASVVLSKVTFKKDGLAGGDDVESVLTRVESLLEEGNIDAAAREMNTLQGWAKILSKDWLGDVRKVLEVRQALDVSFPPPPADCAVC